MVYHDGQPLENSVHPEFLRPATVIERVFSFFLDYIFFAPLVTFLNLILFQNEINLWKSSSNSAELIPYTFSLIVIFVLFFSLLQSFFIYYWQATPGQYFLKLKMQTSNENGLLFLCILLRQLTFWISVPLLGIPWLAVMAHPGSKTFYDRLSEISVVSLKNKPMLLAFELEKKYWRSFIATFTVFLAFLLLGVGWKNYSDIKNKAYTFEKLKKENFFCSEINGVEQELRLDTVIALNLIGQVADVCVDKEADFVLWNSNDIDLKSLAYYGKSLTTSDSSLEVNYLKQACSGVGTDILGCQIADAFKNNKLQIFYKNLKNEANKKNLLVSTLTYELAQILGYPDEAAVHFDNLKIFDSQKLVKKYIVTEVLNHMETKSLLTNILDRKPASLKFNDKLKEKRDLKYIQKLMADL